MKTFKIEIGNRVHEIQAQIDEQGKGWIAVRSLCSLLGVNETRQRRKIEASSRINRCHMASVAEDRKQRNMLCVDIEDVAAWLFSINPNKVKAEIKEQLILFQRKLQLVLYTAVFGDAASSALQKEVIELRNVVVAMQQSMRAMSDTIMLQHAEIQSLKRINDCEASYAGTRLVNQRWTKRSTL